MVSTSIEPTGGDVIYVSPSSGDGGGEIKRALRRRIAHLLWRMVLFLFVGVMYYTFLAAVDWDLLDCLYFITVSVTTVGYGDVVPRTQRDKLFTIVYVTFGIIFVFSSVTDGIGAVLRAMERSAQKQRAMRSTRQGDLEIQGMVRELWWIFAICSVMLVGAVSLCGLQGYGFVDGLFWAFQTTTTIGYGNEVIRHRWMKVFVIFYALVSSIGLTYAIARMVGTVSDVALVRKKEALLNFDLDRDLIRRLDRDGQGVDRAEFVVGMLRILGLIEDEDANPWLDRFDELDTDRDGRLKAADLETMAARSPRHLRPCTQPPPSLSYRVLAYLARVFFPVADPDDENCQLTESLLANPHGPGTPIGVAPVMRTTTSVINIDAPAAAIGVPSSQPPSPPPLHLPVLAPSASPPNQAAASWFPPSSVTSWGRLSWRRPKNVARTTVTPSVTPAIQPAVD